MDYLSKKSVGLKEVKTQDFVSDPKSEFGKKHELVKKMMLSDRDYVEKAKKAFVSYLRSYK